MHSTRHVAISLLSMMPSACVHTIPHQPTSRAEPYAFVSESIAQFTFPVEASNEFSWHAASLYAYDGKPEYVWAIEWGVPDARRGKDPNGLDVAVRWKPTGVRTGNLMDLIRAGEVTVHTECMTCGIPAIVTNQDS